MLQMKCSFNNRVKETDLCYFENYDLANSLISLTGNKLVNLSTGDKLVNRKSAFVCSIPLAQRRLGPRKGERRAIAH